MCVNCPQSRPCAAAGHPMARSAVGGASVTAASASARRRDRGSSTGLAASATTGSASRTMRRRATVGAMMGWTDVFGGASVWFSTSFKPVDHVALLMWRHMAPHILKHFGMVVSGGSVSDAADLLDRLTLQLRFNGVSARRGNSRNVGSLSPHSFYLNVDFK